MEILICSKLTHLGLGATLQTLDAHWGSVSKASVSVSASCYGPAS